RGFNPEIAQLLLKQDYGFELVMITEFAKNPDDLLRLRGRVIGEGGKSRRLIEELTGCYVCVYGKTVGIIGEFEALTGARRAVESLLAGSPHASVYKWLESRRRELKRRELMS
ncbi:MAG: KH domain-containing protein, partial [Candidatus Woesearchaeota archaeon]|nr:KH domain-containing protein [Candidatus Woesearchaeota archaeon]